MIRGAPFELIMRERAARDACGGQAPVNYLLRLPSEMFDQIGKLSQREEMTFSDMALALLETGLADWSDFGGQGPDGAGGSGR